MFKFLLDSGLDINHVTQGRNLLDCLQDRYIDSDDLNRDPDFFNSCIKVLLISGFNLRLINKQQYKRNFK